jgi:hypothetical protein
MKNSKIFCAKSVLDGCINLNFYRKTPLFCAILSGDIKLDKKKEIVKLWFDTYQVDLYLRKKTGEDLLELA